MIQSTLLIIKKSAKQHGDEYQCAVKTAYQSLALSLGRTSDMSAN